MEHNTVNIQISLGASSDADEEELEILSYELIRELNEVEGTQSIEFSRIREMPQGAKGLAIDWGMVALTITQAGIISGLITALSSWLAKEKGRTLELTIGDKSLKLTGLSRKEQQELLEWFQTQAGLRLDR